jgi:hypothetical protein
LIVHIAVPEIVTLPLIKWSFNSTSHGPLPPAAILYLTAVISCLILLISELIPLKSTEGDPPEVANLSGDTPFKLLLSIIGIIIS